MSSVKVGDYEYSGGAGCIYTSVSHGRSRLHDQQNLRRKRYMSRQAARTKSRNRSRIRRLRPLAGVLAAGLSLPLFVGAQSVPYPTYVTGPQPNGSWVVGDGQIITPAGTQIDLGIRVRAKAIALNPTVRNHT